MANAANLEQNQSTAHFPYLKFDYNITQDIVKENYSNNPYVATLQKVAKASVIGLVLIAAFETLKNGAKLLANAAILLANLGYNLKASLEDRKIEPVTPKPLEVEMATIKPLSNTQVLALPKLDPLGLANARCVDSSELSETDGEGIKKFWELNNAVFTATWKGEPTERKRDLSDDLDAAPASPTAEAEEPLKLPEELEESAPVSSSLPTDAPAAQKSDLEIQTQAAITIQRAWRKHQTRKKAALENKAQEEATRNQAATTIQRAWRGHKARKQAALENKAQDDAIRNQAATTIQRAWRDYKARKAEKVNVEPTNPPLAIVANNAAQEILKQEPKQASGNSWNVWSWFKKSA